MKLKEKLKSFVIDAVFAFVFWTGSLTPYMLLVVQTTYQQYINWIIMELILMPPLGVVSAFLLRWIRRHLMHESKV